MTRVPSRQLARKIAVSFGHGPHHVDRMLARQNPAGLPTATRALPGGVLGTVGGARPADAGNALVFTGVPILGPATDRIVDADDAARLLPEHEGAFVALHWDEATGVLTVVTDCLGLQPAYFRHEGRAFTLVSDTRAVDGEPDPAAWGAFLSFGHTIGERTLMRGLRRLPPASVLRFQPQTGRLRVDRYWDWPAPGDDWRTFDFADAMVTQVAAYAEYAPRSALLLSGGLDSRLLLGLLRRAGVDAEALIVAHSDELADADGRYAAAAARAFGLRYQRITPDDGFLSGTDYLAYLEAIDAAFPTLELFIGRVAPHVAAPAVWDGLMPGQLFKANKQPGAGFSGSLDAMVWKPGDAVWRAAAELFHREVVADMQGGFRDDLAAEVGRWPQDEFGVWRFVLANRGRHRPAMNPLKVYTNRSLPLIPGMSRAIVGAAAGIPLEVRRQRAFYLKLLRAIDPRTLAAPIVSGGEPVRRWAADPVYWRTRLNEACLDRLPYRLRRSLGVVKPPPASASAYIGDWLIEPDDSRWIDVDRLRRTVPDQPDGRLKWMLLFYWKTWQWVHQGTLWDRLRESNP